MILVLSTLTECFVFVPSFVKVSHRVSELRTGTVRVVANVELRTDVRTYERTENRIPISRHGWHLFCPHCLIMLYIYTKFCQSKSYRPEQ